MSCQSHVYVVAGASRGIGLQFVTSLLARGEIVVAIARNPDKAEWLHKLAKDGKNDKKLFIVKGDVADAVSIEVAAKETAKRIPGGYVDVLINNAVYADSTTQGHTLISYPSTDLLISNFTQAFQTNVLGPIVTTNAFIPLLRKGSLKKVFTINSGLADVQLSLKGEIPTFTPYCVTKSALEMTNVKYADEGFTFLDIAPGVVHTSATNLSSPNEEEMSVIMKAAASFKKAYPDWNSLVVKL
ncbi:hypothetical protein D9758_005099 [Tetrapyrgos nigripes]|uniref:NAD(P)-binding protein n=1 Tax=Tetrapyrgos nigripes TaxID=182062 RepID=A0A8H5GVI4_9AGAR|nr:hypothetical protein D9758_005099 [Tetrapyrgos nigripes]